MAPERPEINHIIGYRMMASAISYLKKVATSGLAGVTAITFSASIGLVTSIEVQAADDDKPKPTMDKRKTKVIQSLNAPVAKALAKAAEKNDAEDFAGVLEILDGLMKKYDTYNESSKGNIWLYYACTQ